MPIEVLTGVPGSGKTAAIVSRVTSLRQQKKPVYLLLCSDGAPLRESRNVSVERRIASRGGATAAIDYFETTQSTIKTLKSLSSQTSADFVFDEAQYFGGDILPVWCALAERGHNLLISTPTATQLTFLQAHGAQITKLESACEMLSDGPATQFFILPERDTTLAVCDACAEAIRHRAATSISELLIANEPHRGEPRVYQPVEVDRSEFACLAPIRADSPSRAELMREVISSHMGPFERFSRSYLDIGCNTGFFCNRMATLGFHATGVDVIAADVKVGRLLDRFFYRSYMKLICQDAVKFLEEDQSEYDVVSTFSVFQWIYIQSPKEVVDAALQRMFDKTKHILFFEMGYRAEAHYVERLQEPIDRDWCFEKLHNAGKFKSVTLVEAGQRGLKRDLFVAVCG